MRKIKYTQVDNVVIFIGSGNIQAGAGEVVEEFNGSIPSGSLNHYTRSAGSDTFLFLRFLFQYLSWNWNNVQLMLRVFEILIGNELNVWISISSHSFH